MQKKLLMAISLIATNFLHASTQPTRNEIIENLENTVSMLIKEANSNTSKTLTRDNFELNNITFCGWILHCCYPRITHELMNTQYKQLQKSKNLLKQAAILMQIQEEFRR